MEQNLQEITPYQPVKPLVNPDTALMLWESFEELKQKILIPLGEENSDYQRIWVYDKSAGKKVPRDFIKKSGFRKFAMFFGISDEVSDEVREDLRDGEFLWRIKVRATYPNGRETIGVGVCASHEVVNRDRAEHDTYATAHTRAKNRAISDMIAGGIVSAEELGGEYGSLRPDKAKKVDAETRVIGHKKKEPQPPQKKKDSTGENWSDQGFKTSEFIDSYPPGVVKGLSWWEEYLKVNGVEDIEDVVEILENRDRVVIRKKEYLPEDVWNQINNLVKSRDGRWLSEGEKSRWEIMYESSRVG